MRSNSNDTGRIWQANKRISPIMQTAKGIFTFGIEGKQWLACALICGMLLPMFSLPVSASFVYKGNNTANQFEPVNEELSMLTGLWRNLSAKVEAWETPHRAENVSAGDDDKKTKKEKKAVKAHEKINSEKSASETGEKAGEKTKDTEAEKETPTSGVKIPTAKNSEVKKSILSTPLLVNQLPDDERGSMYSYENNLGAPPGQVEMDSSNEAAALRIRHRAGIANFNFGIPLAGLSGRGIDAGVGMTYNSRTWNKSCSQYDTQGNCIQDHFTYDVEQSWIAPGFSSGLGHLTTNFITRNVVMMNGSNTVVKTLTEIVPEGIIDADGTRRQIGCKTWSQIPGGHSSAFFCTAFETSDGSFIKVYRSSGSVYSIDGTVNYGNTSFTVLYPNGSKVFYSTPFGSGNSRKHYPLVIQDSNGNRIRIAYVPDQSGRIAYITDTLNRKIKFYYENDASGNPDKLVAVTIPGMNGSEEIQTVRFYYEDAALNSAGKFIGQITAPATIRVLKYVYMPSTNTGYKYDYHSNYGMIIKITRLAGMTVSDATSLTTTGTVTSDGISAATTEYNFPDGSTALTDVPKYSKRTDDWQGRTSASPQETFYDVPEPSGGELTSRITVKDNGFDVLTETISNGLIKETSVKKVFGPAGQYTQLMAKTKYTWNGRNLIKTETTNEAGLTKATAFEYDGYNNQTAVKEYDFAAPGSLGTLLRTTEIIYETGANWISANLLGLTKSVKTIVGGATVSKSLIEYDHNGSDSTVTRRDDIDIATHSTFYNPARPAWDEEICPDGLSSAQSAVPPGGCIIIRHPGYSPGSAYRGNVTKVGKMIDVNATLIAADPNADVTDYNYDIAGNLVSATLSCCSLKTIAYDKLNEYAFPISETKGSSPQLTLSITYNRNTGLVLTSANENNQVTNYEYEPDTLRPKKTIFPNGGYSLTEYSDKLVTNVNELVPGFVRRTATLETNKFAQSYSYFDGRGLGIRSATQTPDGWSISAVEYDKLGRPVKSFNPFYGATPTASIPGGTKFTEVLGYDAFGRTTSVRLQDNTTVSTEFGDINSTPAGFNKTFVTATDQAGKKRRQIADSLGRIVRVDEPDAGGNLGAVDSPAQPTSYEYDGNDNLSKVVQSDGTVTQERKFKYNSLSRLTHEKMVEANATLDINGVKGSVDPNKWTKVLKYNVDGLLTEGTDARGVKTTFAYDGLNRVANVTFTDGTPAVTYTYDQARTGFYNIGALTRVETAAGDPVLRPDTPATATEYDYDLMGRAVKHRQSIGTQTYALEYGYNIAGQLTSEKYPSGKIVSTGYDANGRLASIADASRTYLSGLQYQGKGGSVSSMTLGNSTTQSFTLNDRLQTTGQELKRGSEVLQKYDYGYGQIDASGNLDTSKNNGQLAKVESNIGAAKQWTQKFNYDSIGRLSESKEYRGDTNALSYKQKFDFDRFGNLYRKAASNPTTGQENPIAFTPIEDADISKSTNRFTSSTTYDDAGNVVTDNKFRSMNFAYDANGRMVKASRASVPDAVSVYDASGMRVAEKVNDVWRFLIYDIGGKMIAEYGGLQSSDEGGVNYVLSDWQGSTRAMVSSTGFVKSRNDYTAFGEDVGSGTGLRTAVQGFGSANNLRQKYGLTERDDATGLDHTWFRKNENRAGRWTSPDPYTGSMAIGNPQSFNRYSYVENQPTNFIDPSGLNLEASGGGYCIRYHYTNGTIGFWGPWTCYGGAGGGDGGGGGGGGAASQQTQNSKATARKQLADFLRFKSKQCADALKALGLTDNSVLRGFDNNIFKNGGSSNNDALTNWYSNGTSDTTTQNGVVDFITNNQPMGWLIHEVGIHAVGRLRDSQAYNRLLSAQRAGNISGLAVLATVTDGPNGTASPAISRYLNSVCNGTIQDSPLPSGGNNQGSTSA